ncbi:MAG: hypothetical protein ABFC57_15105 [Veillonellales bacterium]
MILLLPPGGKCLILLVGMQQAFSQLNYHCDITPPQSAVVDAPVQPHFSYETLSIPLHTDIGDMNVHISLTETK